MTPLLSAPRAYLRDLRSAFVHAPLEVLLGVTLSVTFSVTLHRGEEPAVWWAHVVAFVAISLAPLFALSMLRALGRIRPVVRWAASAALLAAAAAYTWGVFDPHHGAEGWRTAMLAAAGVFLFALVPRVGPRAGGPADRLRSWRFWWAAGTRIVVVGLYAAALYAALAGAIAAVASLFDLKTDGKLYGDLAGAIFFALVPCVVVGGTPEIARATEDGAADVPRWVRLLGRWLYLPVVVIYGGILYAYTVRVLLSGALPKNLLSPLVLFAGLFALLGALALEPLHGDEDARLTGRVMAFVPVLLLPLLPLAFRAVLLRHGQHGWTEFRYLRLAVLIALAVLAVVGALRLLRRRPPLLTTVPAVLAAVLLVSAIGPWSAPAVSRRDQLARLRAALGEAGLLKDGRWALPAYVERRGREPQRVELSRERYDRIHGTVEYLAQEHGTASLASVIPAAGTYPHPWSLAEALPIRPGCEAAAARTTTATLGSGAGVPGVQAGTLYRLRVVGAREADTIRAAGTAIGVVEGGGLRVRLTGPGGWEARADLAPVVARLAALRPDCSSGMYAPTLDEYGEFANASLVPGEAIRPLVASDGRPLGQVVLTRVVVADSVHGGRRFPPRLTDAGGLVVARE